MSDKEVKEFIDKLDAGLKLAEKRMLQEKALRDETVVIYSEDKGIQRIPAKQVISENIMFQ
ncbi:MAG: ribosome recycling factor [Bacteroidaceae bacterium]|nr:ribosome recycling factor [Bacteroidaceae bacterium]